MHSSKPTFTSKIPSPCPPSQINPSQYNEKLDSLLNKIEIQNRYSNRITITNIVNLNRFESVKKELDHIMEVRKFEELNEVQLRNLNSDLNKQIGELKEKLQITSVALLQAKRQIKRLNLDIAKLQQQNLCLQQALLNKKREDTEKITSFKMSIVSNLLESQIKDFLAKVNWARESILISHCRECFANEDYQNFFEKLEDKLRTSNQQKKYSLICPRISRSSSRKKTSPQTNKTTERSGRKIEPNKPEQREENKKIHRRAKTLMPLVAMLP